MSNSLKNALKGIPSHRNLYYCRDDKGFMSCIVYTLLLRERLNNNNNNYKYSNAFEKGSLAYEISTPCLII